MKKTTVIIRLAVFVLILVVANMISSKLYFRLDFTEDKRYTLSRATLDILENLDDVITVKAYFSEDLPTQLISNRQDFEDLLLEYENRSDGNVVYEFISPNEDEEKEREAQQSGIQPVMVNVTEKDQVQQMKAYMGAVLMMAEEREIIPVVQPGVNMEYDLTTSIKKISVSDKPKVALLQGHGEPGLLELTQLAQQLSVLYEVEPYEIKETEDIPAYFKAAAMINPSDTIVSSHFDKLDNYLAQGGSVFVAYSNLNGDLTTGELDIADNIGVSDWLASKQISMGSQFVIDASSGSVTVQEQRGIFNMTRQIRFPYFPMINDFADHPAAKGLDNIMLPFVSALSYSGTDSLVNFTPLMMTSELSGTAATPGYIDVQRRWTQNDFTTGAQVVALALDGLLAGTGTVNSKLVVIANGVYGINGDPPQQLSPDNVNFTSNAIDWLSDDTGLIDLRTKGVSARPLRKVEDATRELLKYGNVLGPIVLMLLYGFIRRQRYQVKRNKWREGSY